MDKLGTIKFSGKSGARYLFAVYPLDAVFDDALSGVYVVTQRRKVTTRKGFVHRRIHIGQSADLRELVAATEPSFSTPGANCICVHAEKNDDARLKIQADLAAAG